jgi:hypothetical protein
MRLKRNDEPAPKRRASRRKHGGNFRRVVAVIVDDEHAAGFAVTFEPAFRAVEVSKR